MVLIKEYGKQVRLYKDNKIRIHKIKKGLNSAKKINKEFLLTKTKTEILKIRNDIVEVALCFYPFYISENQNKDCMKVDFKHYIKLIHIQKKQKIEIENLREESKKIIDKQIKLCFKIIKLKKRSWFEISFPNAYRNLFNFMARILPSY